MAVVELGLGIQPFLLLLAGFVQAVAGTLRGETVSASVELYVPFAVGALVGGFWIARRLLASGFDGTPAVWGGVALTFVVALGLDLLLPLSGSEGPASKAVAYGLGLAAGGWVAFGTEIRRSFGGRAPDTGP
jgi:hypothetical protein